jgi:hypothetical protein
MALVALTKEVCGDIKSSPNLLTYSVECDRGVLSSGCGLIVV